MFAFLEAVFLYISLSLVFLQASVWLYQMWFDRSLVPDMVTLGDGETFKRDLGRRLDSPETLK